MTRDARPLRVLYVLGSLNPLTGGPANSAPHMWISAVRAGMRVTGAFMSAGPLTAGEREMVQRLTDSGVKTHLFATGSWSRQLTRWGVSWRLAFWLLFAARRFDIVQAHGAWMFSSLAALVAAKASGAAFVLTPHESLTESDVVKDAGSLKHAVKRTVKALLLKLSDAVIFASHLERRESVGETSGSRVEVFYHPVVDERIAPTPAKTFSSDGSALRLGFLGRFDSKKNIELLFEAVAQSRATILDMAGSGSEAYERHLRALAERLKIGDRVRWRGFISAAERMAFFSACDVLVMPSTIEGFGMVAGEALSLGTPVIVSSSAGIAELVTQYDCGLVVPPTIDAVAGAIESMSGHCEKLAIHSQNAVKMCAAELTFAAYGIKLAHVYRMILDRHRR